MTKKLSNFQNIQQTIDKNKNKDNKATQIKKFIWYFFNLEPPEKNKNYPGYMSKETYHCSRQEVCVVPTALHLCQIIKQINLTFTSSRSARVPPADNRFINIKRNLSRNKTH